MILVVLQALFAFVLVLAPLVFIHELGHFLAAKMYGIGVSVFSLGFGPRLFGFSRAETDYRVSLIPLGGYVRLMGDESDPHRTGAPEEFLSRSRWQRFVVFVAGATFNIILAFLVMWAFYGIFGKQEIPESYPMVYHVEQGSEAERAGIERGDRIVEIQGTDVKSPQVFLDVFLMEIRMAPETTVPVAIERGSEILRVNLDTGADPEDGSGEPGLKLTWQGQEPAVIARVYDGEPATESGLLVGDRIVGVDGRGPISETELRWIFFESAEQRLELTVERGEEILTLPIEPRFAEEVKGGRVGLGFEPTPSYHRALSLTEAGAEAFRINVKWSKTIFIFLHKLVVGEVSRKSMSGPIGIAQFAREALITGPDQLIFMLGFFSLQLGILNLLPIPVLDGGHILILSLESVMRKEMPERVKERVMLAGLIFLVGVMALIMWGDFEKLLR